MHDGRQFPQLGHPVRPVDAVSRDDDGALRGQEKLGDLPDEPRIPGSERHGRRAADRHVFALSLGTEAPLIVQRHFETDRSRWIAACLPKRLLRPIAVQLPISQTLGPFGHRFEAVRGVALLEDFEPVAGRAMLPDQQKHRAQGAYALRQRGEVVRHSSRCRRIAHAGLPLDASVSVSRETRRLLVAEMNVFDAKPAGFLNDVVDVTVDAKHLGHAIVHQRAGDRAPSRVAKVVPIVVPVHRVCPS